MATIGGKYSVVVNSTRFDVALLERRRTEDGEVLRLGINDHEYQTSVSYESHCSNDSFTSSTSVSPSSSLHVPTNTSPRSTFAPNTNEVVAPIPGIVCAIKCKVGQAIKAGELLLVIEAMKMENPVLSPRDGVVESINVSVGTEVPAGAGLLQLGN